MFVRDPTDMSSPVIFSAYPVINRPGVAGAVL